MEIQVKKSALPIDTPVSHFQEFNDMGCRTWNTGSTGDKGRWMVQYEDTNPNIEKIEAKITTLE